MKTTGVGGEERGYDGAKKVKGRKRHLLVDTQALVLEVRVHSAKVVDREGIKLLLDPSSPDRLPRLSHLWLDAGYTGEGKGADWVQKVLGWTAEIVRHPPKLVPDEVMRRWVMEWAKEGVAIDRERFSPLEGPRPFLPKRWIVERTFSWLGQNRRMSKDYERLPETGEAFVFHADARMFGSIAGEREDVPIEELFAEAESAPGDTGSYRSRVLSVQQTEDAAVGVVAEEGYWGTMSFIVYLLLARIEGDWKIVCKLYAHTAGEPPEGV